jgi:hypothetical protein
MNSIGSILPYSWFRSLLYPSDDRLLDKNEPKHADKHYIVLIYLVIWCRD